MALTDEDVSKMKAKRNLMTVTVTVTVMTTTMTRKKKDHMTRNNTESMMALIVPTGTNKTNRLCHACPRSSKLKKRGDLRSQNLIANSRTQPRSNKHGY